MNAALRGLSERRDSENLTRTGERGGRRTAEHDAAAAEEEREEGRETGADEGRASGMGEQFKPILPLFCSIQS